MRCLFGRLSRVRRQVKHVHNTALMGVRSSVPMGSHPAIKGLCFDMSATSVSPYGDEVVKTISETYCRHHVHLTAKDIRSAMGYGNAGGSKEGNFIALNATPYVREQWKRVYGNYPDPTAVTKLMDTYDPIQAYLCAQVQLIPGFYAALRNAAETYNPVVTFQTGFNRIQGLAVGKVLQKSGIFYRAIVTASDVKHGRPSPDMLLECMRRSQITNPSQMIVFGDTLKDCEAAVAARNYAVGVTGYSSQLNLLDSDCVPVDIFDAHKAREETFLAARMRGAGANHVLSRWSELGVLLHNRCTGV